MRPRGQKPPGADTERVGFPCASNRRDLEQHAADLREHVRSLEDGLALALNTDQPGVARFLVGGDGRYVPCVPAVTALDEQLVS